jgi:hypothetical protein
MISLLFICLSAILIAICDKLKDDFSGSVFFNLSQSFWNPSDNTLPKFLNWVKPNAWHISKALWIVCFLLYGYFFEGGFSTLIVAWILYTIVFELFYSKLLISKTKNK